jgi:aminoglycoside phosphotransferase (APT) family kinase protein
MWLQEKVGGMSATRGMLGSDALSLAPRIAQAAHKIHRCGVTSSRTHNVADELEILESRLLAAAALQPGWAASLTALLENCRALAESLPPVFPCPIHRDFHPGQILVDEDRLWLLDFDLFSHGDPALDVGNFIAHVTELSLRHFGDERHLAGVERELENAYAALDGEGVRPRIAIYAALTLARHVFISTQFPDRRAFTERILKLATERVAQAK